MTITAVIDGVEYPGVKFVSLSPQWANHVKIFTVQAFACDADNVPTPPISTKESYAASSASSASSANSGSAGILPTTSGLAPASASASASAPASASASAAQGSTTPVGVRGSPVLAVQPFPPLNLNAVKQPSSPLPGKHSSRDRELPPGMSSATDT